MRTTSSPVLARTALCSHFMFGFLHHPSAATAVAASVIAVVAAPPSSPALAAALVSNRSRSQLHLNLLHRFHLAAPLFMPKVSRFSLCAVVGTPSPECHHGLCRGSASSEHL